MSIIGVLSLCHQSHQLLRSLLGTATPNHAVLAPIVVCVKHKWKCVWLWSASQSVKKKKKKKKKNCVLDAAAYTGLDPFSEVGLRPTNFLSKCFQSFSISKVEV
jgi:hypothetical protein